MLQRCLLCVHAFGPMYVCVQEVMRAYVSITIILLLTIFMKYINPEISFL